MSSLALALVPSAKHSGRLFGGLAVMQACFSTVLGRKSADLFLQSHRASTVVMMLTFDVDGHLLLPNSPDLRSHLLLYD